MSRNRSRWRRAAWRTPVEGVYAPATIGAHVYTDANANGTQDAGDASLAGVTVSLLNANGTPTGKGGSHRRQWQRDVQRPDALAATKCPVAPPAGDSATQKVNVQKPITLASGGMANAVEGVLVPPPVVVVSPAAPVAGANAGVGLVAVGTGHV